MNPDIDERLTRIEQAHDQQRQRWIAAAAKTAGVYDPGLAAKLIDPTDIVTSGDADRAVANFVAEHPYMRQEQITPEEQKRRWGQEILDAIDRA